MRNQMGIVAGGALGFATAFLLWVRFPDVASALPKQPHDLVSPLWAWAYLGSLACGAVAGGLIGAWLVNRRR